MASLYLSQNRPMSLNKTAYGEANEWMKMPGKIIPDNVPVTLSDGNWRRIPMMPGNRRNVYDSTPEERFQKAYQEMTQRIAYRHPNPGMPRSRQGRIGGTWRHVKEVLGHSGSQICFVDGLVRMYDSSNMNESLSAAATTRPHLSSNAPRERAILPAYAPQIPPKTPRCRYKKYDITDHTGRVQAHQAYEYEQCLPSVRAPSGTPNVSGKYQGFYRLK